MIFYIWYIFGEDTFHEFLQHHVYIKSVEQFLILRAEQSFQELEFKNILGVIWHWKNINVSRDITLDIDFLQRCLKQVFEVMKNIYDARCWNCDVNIRAC